MVSFCPTKTLGLIPRLKVIPRAQFVVKAFVALEPPPVQVAVDVVVTVVVMVVVFAPPMAVYRLAEISTPAMTITAATTMYLRAG
jgi:hypothetical protein